MRDTPAFVARQIERDLASVMRKMEILEAEKRTLWKEARELRAEVERLLALLRECEEYMTHAPICRGMPQCNCGYLNLDRRIDAILSGKEPRQ